MIAEALDLWLNRPRGPNFSTLALQHFNTYSTTSNFHVLKSLAEFLTPVLIPMMRKTAPTPRYDAFPVDIPLPRPV